MKEVNAVTLGSQVYPAVPNGSSTKGKLKGAQSFDSFLNTSNNTGAGNTKTDTVKAESQVKDNAQQPADTIQADTVNKQPDNSNMAQQPGEDMAGTDSVANTDAPGTDMESSISKEGMAVTAVSEAVKEAVKDITGLDDGALEEIMAALSMSYTDLLDMGNLKQFIMYINNTSDVTDLLMDESMMSQLNNLADVIADIDIEALTGMTEDNFAKLLQSIADGSFKMPEDGNAMAAGQEGLTQADIPVTAEYAGGEVLQAEAGQEEIVQFTVTKEAINTSGDAVQKDTDKVQEDGVLQPGKEARESADTTGSQAGLKQGTGNQAESTFTESTQTQTQTEARPVVHEETFNSQAGFIQNLAQAAADVQDKAMPQQANMQTMINIVNQVVEQIKVTMGKEMTNMQLQLNPESLGKVLISVTSNHGVMTANFTVQSEEAKEALQSQMFSLREALESRSLKVDAVEVEVSDFAFSQSSQADSQNQKEFDKGNGRRFRFSGGSGDEEADSSIEVSKSQPGKRLDNGSSIDFTA